MLSAAARPRPNLQPLGLGELLDRTIRLYRRNFFTFLGILGIVYIPLSLIQVLISVATANQTLGAARPDQVFTPAYFATQGLALFNTLLSAIFVSGIATAALTVAISDSYFGEPVTIGGAYRRLGRSWLSLLGTLFLAGLVLIVASVYWIVVPCLGWFTGLGIMTFLSYIVIPLLSAIVVLERRGGTAALRRAWDLSRTRFWWMFGFAFILFLFGLLVLSGPILVVSYVVGLVITTVAPSTSTTVVYMAQTVLQGLIGMIFGLLYLPLRITALTLVYFDLRARSEGLDLAVQSADPSLPAADVIAKAPAASDTGLVTRYELLWFFIITIAIFVLYGIFFGGILAIVAAFSRVGGAF